MDRARKQTWLAGLLAVGAGLAFATCTVPPKVLFKCESGGRCLQPGYVCVEDHCVPPELLDGGADGGADGGVDGGVDAGCAPVDPGWSWDAGNRLPKGWADFGVAPSGDGGYGYLVLAGGATPSGPQPLYATLNAAAPPTWVTSNTSAPSLSRMRSAWTPFADPLGFVMSGGVSDAGVYLNTVVVASSLLDTAQDLAPMATARADHAMVGLDGLELLVAGGRTNAGLLGSVEIYDGGWTTLPVLIEPRARHTLTRLSDGRVLLAGGEVDAGVSDSLVVFTPGDGGWADLGAKLDAGRAGHVALSIGGGQVLFVGGEPTGKVEIFDPAAGRVVQVYSLGFDAIDSSAAFIDEKGMALVVGSDGGIDAPPEAAWCNACGCVPAPRPSAIRYGAKVARIPGYNVLLLIGGRDPRDGGPVADVEYMLWP